jgi:hypothetical protein
MAITPNRPLVDLGTTNGSFGQDYALSLKVYSGEVLKAFEQKNMLMQLIRNVTITGGKSAQFIVTGQLPSGTNTHTPGDDVSTEEMDVSERTITIDRRKYKATFIDDFETKLAHYDTRSVLAEQAGYAIANQIDADIGTHLGGILGTSSGDDLIAGGLQFYSSIVTSTYTPTTFNALSALQRGDHLIEKLFELEALMDSKDVPEDRVLVVDRQTYFDLVQSTRGVNADFTSGNGDFAQGKIMEVAGRKVVWTNRFASIAAAYKAKKGDDSTNLKAVLVNPGVMGIVKFMDVVSEANYIPEKMGWLLNSYYAVGYGTLNPALMGGVVLTDL